MVIKTNIWLQILVSVLRGKYRLQILQKITKNCLLFFCGQDVEEVRKFLKSVMWYAQVYDSLHHYYHYCHNHTKSKQQQQNPMYLSMPSKYLPHKIHLTAHSVYGCDTQESLISPILRVGGLGFSGSHHAIHYVSFLLENICLWAHYQWFVTSTLESTLVSSKKKTRTQNVLCKRFVQKLNVGEELNWVHIAGSIYICIFLHEKFL